ncbi:MAG TPA: N-acetyl-gamma-glutamyl-phosphate reductase [Candidatus Omnitrophota bacterium]|nr:N-acetyl-gamma-glutamyl-phosphate reductase [Candidatus Omnitrophota bacterium]
MLNCAVLGATGYTGAELTKLLLAHPHVRISLLTTRQEKSIPLREILPSVSKKVKLEITPYSFDAVKKKADLVFLCLPHTEAMTAAEQFLAAGKVVIDLSADFRLRDKKIYEKWYGVNHVAPQYLSKAIYGLCEVYKEKIKKADLIANPGCYPTGPSLALIPLLKAKLIAPNSIIINAASGVSGAGKKLVAATQFCEASENYSAYKVNKHQHTPEIEQTLSAAAGKPVKITFVPHLLPVNRGILATIYADTVPKATEAKIRKALEAAYRQAPFVRIKPAGQYPSLKDVQYTNFCDIGVSVQEGTGRVVIIAAIDNLVKGAAGQAVQNMNIRFGFPEEAGLS